MARSKKSELVAPADLRRSYERQIQQTAKRFRAHVLIPFCDKYKAVFVSGMGGWSLFLKTDTQYGDDLEESDVRRAAKIPWSELRGILSALRATIIPYEYDLYSGDRGLEGRHDTFGYCVGTYDTREEKK